jgi:hypothetical protein
MPPSEVSSPFPEAYQHDMSEKEVVIPPAIHHPYESPNTIRPPPKRICGIQRRWFILTVLLIIVLAIALGVGLGVGLHSDSYARSSLRSEVPLTASVEARSRPPTSLTSRTTRSVVPSIRNISQKKVLSMVPGLRWPHNHLLEIYKKELKEAL